MITRIKNSSKVLIVLTFFFALLSPVSAAGTRSSGWVLVKNLVKFESGGLVVESWEGVFQVDRYNKAEKCKEKDYTCFTPVVKTLKFSVRPTNKKAVRFLIKHKGAGGFLVKYKKHRFEPFALSTRFEILEARERDSVTPDLPVQKLVRKTGSRNFSFKGEVLKFERDGFMIKTYEGIYRNLTTGKVHPFSITDSTMAAHITKAMQSQVPYFLGISVARVKGFRKSTSDIFEINYKEEAGGISDNKEDKKS